MSFGQLKQNFEVGDWVRMGNFGPGNEQIEGRIGRIGGQYTESTICDFYIVILNKPWPTGAVAVVMIESCLEPFDVYGWRVDSPRTMPDGGLCEFRAVPGGSLSSGLVVAP